jgi:hypothetical protein
MKRITIPVAIQKQSHLHLLTVAVFLVGLLTPAITSAAGINNGGFSTENFNGWSLDTDGFGEPTLGSSDFTVVESASNNPSARVEVDFFSTAGDSNSSKQGEAFFANTLFQEMDLTLPDGFEGTPSQWQIQLNFDWAFGGEQLNFDDNFLVAIGDGSGNYFDEAGNTGFLLNPESYGSGSFSVLMSPDFNNTLGWTLEFQLDNGIDGYGSYIQIDNIDLVAVSNVPVPAAFWLFSSCLFGLRLITGRPRQLHT